MVGGIIISCHSCACEEVCAVGQQMPKREKGKGESRSLQWPLFPFGVVRPEREDVDLMTPPSALKACFPFPFSPFGF
jgi:hypothetical protein